jgi:hypothetical protein
MIYGFMDAEKASLPIRLMCRRLGVSPAGFYEWQARQQNPSTRVQEDAALTATIAEIVAAGQGPGRCPGRYGGAARAAAHRLLPGGSAASADLPAVAPTSRPWRRSCPQMRGRP